MTKAEREWCDQIKTLGCIACIVSTGIYGTPGCIHHILKSGRRQSHLETLCLCDPGHHQYAPAGSGKISRHPFKARFEAKYGSEARLLERTKELVGVPA